MAQYKDRVLEHDIDGIKEYDNPLPGWLMGILWGTIAFSVVYLAFYALAFGPHSYSAELRQDDVRRHAELQAWFDENPLVPPTKGDLLAGARDPETLKLGRDRFVRTCAACHGESAQGLIGPNLADDRWLHGGQVTQIFSTVAKGVPAKGMPPWGRAIAPGELSALVSYIRSVQGSTPPGAKAPEGDVVAPEPLPQ